MPKQASYRFGKSTMAMTMTTEAFQTSDRLVFILFEKHNQPFLQIWLQFNICKMEWAIQSSWMSDDAFDTYYSLNLQPQERQHSEATGSPMAHARDILFQLR